MKRIKGWHIVRVKRQRLKRLLTILRHVHTVSGTKIANRRDETRIVNTVQRVRRRWDKTANQLMLPLRTRIKGH